MTVVVQEHKDVVGSRTSPKLIAGSYTTNGFADNVIEIAVRQQVTLYVFYTMGATETGNSIQVRLSFSQSATNPKTSQYWARFTAEEVTPTTITSTLPEFSFDSTTAAGTYQGFVINVPANHGAMWVQCKETGAASNVGSFFVEGTFISY